MPQIAGKEIGRVWTHGRFHCLPKTLQDDYTLSKTVLGEGMSGQVFMGQSKRCVEKVAIKSFKLLGLSKNDQRDLKAEAQMFLSMDHPHVARLLDVYETKDELSLVTECLSGGELFDRVKELGKFSEKEAARDTKQMLLAISYIHSHNVTHRDIKLENFLYETKENRHIKLIDFGFAKIVDTNSTMSENCGTLHYMAPEVLTGKYDSQCDVWSLGVSVFILLFGRFPFGGSDRKVKEQIKAGQYYVEPNDWKTISPAARDFLEKMLVVAPEKRMTAAMALAHPWIRQQEQGSPLKRLNSDKRTSDALVKFGEVSSIRRAAQYMMAWGMSLEDQAKVRQLFLDLDTDNTGTLTLEEFKQAIEVSGLNGAEAAFRAMDLNSSGEINYSEFLAAMAGLSMNDNSLKAVFARLDNNGDGTIGIEELKQLLGDNYDEEAVHQFIQTKCGGDEQMDEQEFLAFMNTVEGCKADAAPPPRSTGKEISWATQDVGGNGRHAKDNCSAWMPRKDAKEISWATRDVGGRGTDAKDTRTLKFNIGPEKDSPPRQAKTDMGSLLTCADTPVSVQLQLELMDHSGKTVKVDLDLEFECKASSGMHLDVSPTWCPHASSLPSRNSSSVAGSPTSSGETPITFGALGAPLSRLQGSVRSSNSGQASTITFGR